MKAKSEKDENRNKKHHFRNLLCWQKARTLRIEIYKIAKKLPDNERYALANQMRRAAVSITSNIAEGYGRYHYQENIQFCRQSRASIYECEDHLVTCLDEGFISKEGYEDLVTQIIETRKILDGYINYLKKLANKI